MRLIKRLLLFFLGLGATVHAASAYPADRAPRVLEPNGPWTVARRAERCTLVWNFGEEGANQLQIESYGSKQSYRFVLWGDIVPRSSRPRPQIRLGFSPDTLEREPFSALQVYLANRTAVTFISGFFPHPSLVDPALYGQDLTAEQVQMVRRLAAEFESQVVHMTLQMGSGTPVRLNTGGMVEPLKAMHECVDGLMVSWGIDPLRYQAQSRSPRLLPDALARLQGTLPMGRGRGGAVAFVPLRVMVDEQGSPTACVVQAVIADEIWKRAVCDSLSSPFEPALDAEGKPVASVFQTTIIYAAF